MYQGRVFRVGEKIISMDKVYRMAERIMELREQGVSQQETAVRLNLDRSFVSRLEAAGEIRRGSRVAVIGFPLANVEELSELCFSYGLDYYLLMTNRERWVMVRDQKALDFIDRVFEMIALLRDFDTLVMISSEKWYRLAEVLLDLQVLFINLGPTPIREDCYVEPGLLDKILAGVTAGK